MDAIHLSLCSTLWIIVGGSGVWEEIVAAITVQLDHVVWCVDVNVNLAFIRIEFFLGCCLEF